MKDSGQRPRKSLAAPLAWFWRRMGESRKLAGPMTAQGWWGGEEQTAKVGECHITHSAATGISGRGSH